MRKIQRRDFLKAMGLPTAALGLTACGGSGAPAHPAFPVHRLPAAVPRPLRHSRKLQRTKPPPQGPL